MSARGFDQGDLSWDAIAERLKLQRDEALARAEYWKNRYEALAHEHGGGQASGDFLGAVE